jgi:hypothetical protein
MHDAVMYRNFALLFACAAISACAPITQASTPTAPAPSSPSDGIARASLGERVYVDGPYVTPLEVLEDSRCPADVMCVWAGRLRIKAGVDLGSGSTEHELTLGQPIHVADGNLTLVEASPARKTKTATPPEGYRFGFRFMGGY